MKNTMKKLLCMTLVIMLLVSAVPMFAAAEDLDLSDRVLVYEYYDQDGNFIDRVTGTDPAGVISTGDIASGAQWWMGSKCPGCTYVGLGAMDITQAGKAIFRVNVNKLATAKVSIIIRLNVKDDKAYNYQVGTVEATEVPETMSKENALLKLNGAADSLNVNITSASATKDLNGSEAVYAFSAEKKTTNNGGTGSGSTGGSGSGSGSNGGSGSGTLTKFKATFLNANGLEFYSESVVSNAKLTVSASTLNNGVGTKAGYEHIGWKSSTGKTQITEEVLRDTITANVTYAPIFKNLTNNTTEVPGSGIISGGGSVSNGSGSALHDKVSDLQDVILHVYLNNNFNSEHKHYTITSIAKDGTLSLKGDVKDFLKQYYTAKNSDGIGYDGMYVTDAYFGVKYLSDEKYEVLGNDADANGNTTLDKMRSAGVVHLNVMLTNAVAKSSVKADSSNYKTGDTIFVPVMAMGLTGTLLAAAYIFGKKRFAR